MKKQVDYIIIRARFTRQEVEEAKKQWKDSRFVTLNYGPDKRDGIETVCSEDFVDKIKEYMANGWVCQGTPIVNDDGLSSRIQAMVKYEE